MSELFTTATAQTILADRKAKETDFLCGILKEQDFVVVGITAAGSQ